MPTPIHPYLAQYARLFSLIGAETERGWSARERREALEVEMKAVPDIRAFRALLALHMKQAWERGQIKGNRRNTHNRAARWVGAYRVFRKYHTKLPKAIEVRAVGKSGVYVLRFIKEDKSLARLWARFEKLCFKLGIPEDEAGRLRAENEVAE